MGQCLLSELCSVDSSEVSGGVLPAGLPDEELGASIFDHGSRMGLIPEELEDHWTRDRITATWTRVIVVPIEEFYHPSEGSADNRGSAPLLSGVGPDLSTLRDT